MQELIPKTFELLVLILLQPGVEFQDHTLSQSKIIELQKHPPQKICFFWSSPHKIEVISTIQFESRDKILLVTSWTEIMTS